jgi:hypothetical protein
VIDLTFDNYSMNKELPGFTEFEFSSKCSQNFASVHACEPAEHAAVEVQF